MTPPGLWAAIVCRPWVCVSLVKAAGGCKRKNHIPPRLFSDRPKGLSKASDILAFARHIGQIVQRNVVVGVIFQKLIVQIRVIGGSGFQQIIIRIQIIDQNIVAVRNGARDDRGGQFAPGLVGRVAPFQVGGRFILSSRRLRACSLLESALPLELLVVLRLLCAGRSTMPAALPRCLRVRLRLV